MGWFETRSSDIVLLQQGAPERPDWLQTDPRALCSHERHWGVRTRREGARGEEGEGELLKPH
eukprot:2079320-Pyramimonas_sp.AAC.1